VKRILAGDVGGTKTLLQCVSITEDGHSVEIEKRYETSSFPSLNAMLREFLAGQEISSACFAIAGPVFGSRASLTNVGWEIDAGAIGREFGMGTISLVNDFYAVARGIPVLTHDDYVTIQQGEPEAFGPIGIVGAGTGLGEAILIPAPSGHEWRIVPSEGGHCDFAPQGELQQKLLAMLAARYEHVSYERVVSGQGLVNIFTFLRDHLYGGRETASRDLGSDTDSLPAHISEMDRKGDELSKGTFDLFIDVYGAEAGNLALKILARGGIFLAGGIAAKNLDRFRDGRFVEAFCNKGRFRALMQRIPIHVITNTQVGLLGAREFARLSA
jgi:glucokinase